MVREEALALLKKYVKENKLIKHSLAVEAAMRAYAKHFGEDIEAWGQVGLLHDVDYEIYPEEHPKHTAEFLKDFYNQEFIDDIVSHGYDVDVKRDTKIRKTLHAVDEMASFILAIAILRPNKLEDLKAKSVKKKMKDKAFAKAVNREELVSSCEDLEMEFADHVDIIVNGLKEQEEKLQKEGYSLLA